MAIQTTVHPAGSTSGTPDKDYSNYKIVKELLSIKSDYEQRPITIVDGLPFSQYGLIRTVELYTNSAYENGIKDELGRDKPFYNIVNTNVDVSVVATDIDTKDIQIVSDDPQDYDKSFLLSKEVHQWMKDENFAKTLNDIGETRARYGGVLVKKCMVDGELQIDVCQWKNLITDQIDIENGVIIEKHYMQPMDILAKEGTWSNTKQAIKILATKQRRRATMKGGQTNRATLKEVPVFEIHGEFPVAFYKELEGEEVTEDDNYTYGRYVCYIAGDESTAKVPLYWAEEDENPYRYLPWKEVSGRGLGRGVVEEGIEAQVWTNDVVLKRRNALELASKVVVQTATKRFKGSNIINEIENGSILEVDANGPIESVQLTPSSGFPEFDNVVESWFTQYQRTTATYDAQRGETPPANQPFALQALIQQQAATMFDYRKQEAGDFITELFMDWVFPYVTKKFNKKHILSWDFSPDELKTIDTAYGTARANEHVIGLILSGKIVNQADFDFAQQTAMQGLQKSKTQRFFDIPKGYYSNINAHVTVVVTGEQQNKAAMLGSLSQILTVIASNPAILQDPAMSQILNKIIELSGIGISPIELTNAAQQRMQAPTGGQQQMMQQQQPGQPPGQPGQPQPAMQPQMQPMNALPANFAGAQ